MIISDLKSISEIQSEFSNLFPGLKIEFYSARHKPHEGSPVTNQYISSMRLADIRTKHNTEDIGIHSDMSVAELEKLFEDNLGLYIQVFRRSGTLWLQTTKTDDWTLEVQNRKGLHSLEAISPE